MSLVSINYAEGLFELAKEKDSVEEYRRQVEEIRRCFNLVEDLRQFFLSVKISKTAKKKLIDDTLGDKYDKYVINFIKLLIDKDRIDIFDDICKEFRLLCNDELSYKEGIIESARELTADQIKLLEKTLSNENEKVELIPRINTSLISGFRIIFDGQIIDNSMKEKIRKLNENLLRKDGGSWN